MLFTQFCKKDENLYSGKYIIVPDRTH